MSLLAAHASQLPADVVCEILSLLVVLDPPRPVRHSQPPCNTLGWINCTHVCRRWRAIGVDLASLWSTSTCSLPNVDAFVMTAISRARATPITINLEKDLSEPRRAVFRDLVSRHPERIRELKDDVVNPRRWYACMKNKNFPNLLVLSIAAHGPYKSDTPGAFCIDTPNLHSLTLYEPSSAVVAPKLRSLSLRCKKNRPDCNLSLLLRSLQCAPEIEHLELWVPLHIQFAAGITDSVNLPRAKHVELSGSLAGCAALCEKVIFSSDVHIVVDAMVPATDPFTTVPLLRALKAQLAHHLHDTLRLDTSGGGRSGQLHPCMNITLESSIQSEGGRLGPYRPGVALEIGIYKKGLNDSRKRDLIVAEFFANVSTLDVKNLSIARSLEWLDFERAFKPLIFPSVHTISIDFLAMRLLYEANVKPIPAFPALRHLIVSKQRGNVQRGQWISAWSYLNKTLALVTDSKLSVEMTPSNEFKWGTIGYPQTDAKGVEDARKVAAEFVDERLTADYRWSRKNEDFKDFEN